MATSNFQWPEISQSQSSKYATHNEALEDIDGKLGQQLSKDIAGTGIVTLVASSESGVHNFIDFTGLLTGNRTVRFPGGNGTIGGGLWWVRNSTTGAFTVTIDHQTGAGTNFVLPRTGYYVPMFSDQVNQVLMDVHQFPERDGAWSGTDVDFYVAERYYARTLTANLTLTFSNPVLGRCVLLELEQDGTGTRTLTLPAEANVIDGTFDTTASAVNHVKIECIDADTPKYLVWIWQE